MYFFNDKCSNHSHESLALNENKKKIRVLEEVENMCFKMGQATIVWQDMRSKDFQSLVIQVKNHTSQWPTLKLPTGACQILHCLAIGRGTRSLFLGLRFGH